VIDVELLFTKVILKILVLFIYTNILGCYNADTLDDKSSDSSSPSEYWFCTPCLAQIDDPVRQSFCLFLLLYFEYD
jgi:hypothetical protein